MEEKKKTKTRQPLLWFITYELGWGRLKSGLARFTSLQCGFIIHSNKRLITPLLIISAPWTPLLFSLHLVFVIFIN